MNISNMKSVTPINLYGIKKERDLSQRSKSKRAFVIDNISFDSSRLGI